MIMGYETKIYPMTGLSSKLQLKQWNTAFFCECFRKSSLQTTLSKANKGWPKVQSLLTAGVCTTESIPAMPSVQNLRGS